MGTKRRREQERDVSFVRSSPLATMARNGLGQSQQPGISFSREMNWQHNNQNSSRCPCGVAGNCSTWYVTMPDLSRPTIALVTNSRTLSHSNSESRHCQVSNFNWNVLRCSEQRFLFNLANSLCKRLSSFLSILTMKYYFRESCLDFIKPLQYLCLNSVFALP